MYPYPIIEIGKLSVHLYGVCIAVGILLCILVLRYYGKRLKVDQKFLDFVELNAYVAIALGFFFAAVFQGLYNYIEDPSSGFSLNGGITFLGGLIGGAATFLTVYFIMRKKYVNNFMDVISIIPCCILLAHGFGRIGCFFAGCCYGIETDSWLGIRFPGMINKVYPTQLFEALFLFIMFGVTSYLALKKNFKHNFSVYLISYGVFRFLLEYIRGDDRGAFFGIFSPSQFWSIILVLIGIGLIFFVNYYYNNLDNKSKSKKGEKKEKVHCEVEELNEDN